MELADPTIADGIKKCIDDDAEYIIAILCCHLDVMLLEIFQI